MIISEAQVTTSAPKISREPGFAALHSKVPWRADVTDLNPYLQVQYSSNRQVTFVPIVSTGDSLAWILSCISHTCSLNTEFRFNYRFLNLSDSHLMDILRCQNWLHLNLTIRSKNR